MQLRNGVKSTGLMILVAGPYRSGTGDDPAKLAANMDAMEACPGAGTRGVLQSRRDPSGIFRVGWAHFCESGKDV
jgi:hypothetical protein